MGTTNYEDKLGQPQKSINNRRQPDSRFVFLLKVHSSLSVSVLCNHKLPSHLLQAALLSNDSDDPATLSKDVRGREKPDYYK